MSHAPTIDDYTPDKVRDLVATTPASGTKRSLGVIAAVATLGSLLFGYDTGVIAGALPYMYMPGNAGGLHMTTFEEGWVGGLLCIGAAAGAFFGGRLSDRYGRRHNITLLAIVFLFGAIGCAIAPNIWVLYLARIILGFAVGGASATVPVFLGETAPKRLRGVLVATDQMMIVFGQFMAFSMNAVIARWQGGPTVTLTGDAVDASGHVLGQAGTSVAWETVQAAVNIADVTSAGNGLTWRYMLILCSSPRAGMPPTCASSRPSAPSSACATRRRTTSPASSTRCSRSSVPSPSRRSGRCPRSSRSSGPASFSTSVSSWASPTS